MQIIPPALRATGGLIAAIFQSSLLPCWGRCLPLPLPVASDRWFLGWPRPLFERFCPFCALLSSILLFASLWASIFLRFWLPKSVQNRPKIDAKMIIDASMFCSSFCNSFFQPFLLHVATANLQKVLFFQWFFNVFTFRNQRPPTNHPIKILSKIHSILASKMDQNGIENRSAN